jgi:hypothetical protein
MTKRHAGLVIVQYAGYWAGWRIVLALPELLLSDWAVGDGGRRLHGKME